MLIKNVSSRILRFSDFPYEKPIMPGGVLDLSKYTAEEKAKSQDLKDLFDKGELICIGHAAPSPVMKKMMVTPTKFSKYEIKEESLKVGDSLIPKKQMSPVVIGSMNKRDQVVKTTTVPERYNTKALQKYAVENENPDSIPAFESKDFQAERKHSFVQIQNEQEVVTITLDEETNTTYAEPKPGQIATAHLLDPSVFVDDNVYPVSSQEDAQDARKRLQNKLQEKIIDLVEKKCLSPKVNGTPCNRQVLKGYNACFEHLSKQERILYLKGKENESK